MGKKWSIITVVMLLTAFISSSAFAATSELQLTDCIKCHAKVVQDVETKGGLHMSAVSCLDMWSIHPAVKMPFPSVPSAMNRQRKPITRLPTVSPATIHTIH